MTKCTQFSCRNGISSCRNYIKNGNISYYCVIDSISIGNANLEVIWILSGFFLLIIISIIILCIGIYRKNIYKYTVLDFAQIQIFNIQSKDDMINNQQNMVLSKNQTLKIFFFQFLGTFLLTFGTGCAILGHGNSFTVACSLFLALSLSGQITGGHFNPFISIASYINKPYKKMFIYIIAHLFGSIVGGILFYLLSSKIYQPYNQQDNPNTIDLIKYVLNQFIGSFFFSVCVLTLTNKLTTHAFKSWQVYLSIPVAYYLTKKLTGDTVLNPAIGIVYQIIASIAKESLTVASHIWILLVPSCLGGILGGLVMSYLYQPLLLSIRFKEQLQKDQQQ